MDIDTINLGVDFDQQIKSAVGASDVFLAIIGPRWVEAVDDQGNKRLNNPNDFVRIEIGTALKRNILVIPVLIDGQTMPQSSELPDDLVGLIKKNGLEIRHTQFNSDTEKLIKGIEEIFPNLQFDVSDKLSLPNRLVSC